MTDRNGVFIYQVPPGEKKVSLKVKSLGYQDRETTVRPEAGQKTEVDLLMKSENLETLQAFDVEGAEYMVELKSAVKEHRVSPETFDKFAIDSVEKALSKQAGVVAPKGQTLGHAAPMARGGRREDTLMAIDGVADAPQSEPLRLRREANTVPRPGSVTGGTTPPNGQQFELMYFQHAGVNPFVATEEDALSTFAVDVDNASYTLVRNYLGRGALPPADAVRVEEFVNFFDGGYPVLESDRAEHAFAVHTDGSESLFGSGYQMLRVGLQGMTITDEDRKPCTLIFVIDVSGSMNRENRLGTVKRSLGILLDQLGQGDRVGLVTYGSHGQVVLKPTGLENREAHRAGHPAPGARRLHQCLRGPGPGL